MEMRGMREEANEMNARFVFIRKKQWNYDGSLREVRIKHTFISLTLLLLI